MIPGCPYYATKYAPDRARNVRHNSSRSHFAIAQPKFPLPCLSMRPTLLSLSAYRADITVGIIIMDTCDTALRNLSMLAGLYLQIERASSSADAWHRSLASKMIRGKLPSSFDSIADLT